MLRRPLASVAACVLLLSLSASAVVTTGSPIWRDGAVLDPVDGHLRMPTAGGTSVVPQPQVAQAASIGSLVIDPQDRAQLRESYLYGRGGATGALSAVENVIGDIFGAELRYFKTDGTAIDLGLVRMETLANMTVAAQDVLATVGGDGQHAVDWVDLTDLNTQTVDRVLLNGLRPIKTIGRTVIASTTGDANGGVAIHLLRNDGGTVSDVVVPAPPCQLDRLGDGDAQAVIAFCTNRTVGLINLQTGAFTSVSQTINFSTPYVSRLTSTHVIWLEYPTGPLYWAPRSGGTASSPAAAPQSPLLGMSGQWLVLGDADHRFGHSPLTALPPGGGPAINLVDAPMWLAQLPDQTLLTLAGTSLSQGLFHIAPGAGGTPVATKIRNIPPSDAPTLAINVEGRRLITVDASNSSNWVGDRNLGSAGPLVAGPRRTIAVGVHQESCNAPCALLLSTGATTLYRTLTEYVIVDARGQVRRFPVPPGFNRDIVQLTDTYASWWFSGFPQSGELVEISTGRRIDPPSTPYTLWGSTLWTPQTDYQTTGKVYGVNIKTGDFTEITTPGRCHPMTVMLQVVGRWLSWECSGGASAPSSAGVVDMTTGRQIPLSLGTYTHLGDGYLIYSDLARTLHRVNLTANPPTTTIVASMGDALIQNWMGKQWNLDRFGGQVVAWSDNAHRVHVEPVGVAATSPLTVLHAEVPTTIGGPWRPTWVLSKPANWTLTIRSGGVVSTFTGSTLGTAVIPDWVPAGDRSRTSSGASWTLALVPADGVGSSLNLSGSIASRGPVPPRLPVGP